MKILKLLIKYFVERPLLMLFNINSVSISYSCMTKTKYRYKEFNFMKAVQKLTQKKFSPSS